jgi:alkylated DNA repair dioxygenase AlkB
VSLPPGFEYRPGFLSPAERAALLAALLEETPWEDHELVIFGRRVPMPRRIAWYGPVDYSYSGVRHPARPLTPRLEAVRARLEAGAGLRFNAALVNLYRHGRDSMGWHSDDDYDCGDRPAIASVSLGATRRFRLRSRPDGARRAAVDLEDGSLLLMTGDSQRRWQHSLARTARPAGPRINLTWRWIR